MKVLHILNELRNSGMEMMLLNSYDEWAKYNVNPSILSTGAKFGEASKPLEEKGYDVFHIPFYGRKYRAFGELFDYLRKNKFDIIHIHTEGNFLLHVLCAKLTFHKSVIRTVHSIFSPGFLGKLRRRADRCISIMLKVKFVAPGDSVALNEKQHYFTNCIVIYNWYDSIRFNLKIKQKRNLMRSALSINNETFVITSIGNCSTVKRHFIIFESLAKIKADIDWRYLHVGVEDPSLQEREIAKMLGIESRCMFLGSVQKVEDLLAATDLYIMTSRIEGLSIAAIEAIGSGIPVLLTEVPGLIDILNAIDGTIPADSQGKNLSKLIEDFYYLPESERVQIGKSASEQCHLLFSMERGVNEYIAFYTKLLMN